MSECHLKRHKKTMCTFWEKCFSLRTKQTGIFMKMREMEKQLILMCCFSSRRWWDPYNIQNRPYPGQMHFVCSNAQSSSFEKWQKQNENVSNEYLPPWLRCSQSHSPCQVPRLNLPSVIGMVTLLPIRAALMWAGYKRKHEFYNLSLIWHPRTWSPTSSPSVKLVSRFGLAVRR